MSSRQSTTDLPASQTRLHFDKRMLEHDLLHFFSLRSRLPRLCLLTVRARGQKLDSLNTTEHMFIGEQGYGY